jgi:hypothetical protein
MYEIFNPEIPGLEPPNPGISGLRNMSGIPGMECQLTSKVYSGVDFIWNMLDQSSV